MNEDGCLLIRDHQRRVAFPDIPPVELCRRHSCLDNFVLSSCVAKATDNLARLDQILSRQQLTDTVKRSYRASFAQQPPIATASARALCTEALLTDSHPSSDRAAEDVHGLLENLGALIRRLERDINKTWERTQELEGASALVRRDMRRTSGGCHQRLDSTVGRLWDDWRRDRCRLETELQQACQQDEHMAAALTTLQQRAGHIGHYVRNVRDDGATVGEQARLVFVELRQLKSQLHATVRERCLAVHHACRAQQLLERHHSDVQLCTLQRTVRRRRMQERLRVSLREVAVTTTRHSLMETRLSEAAAEAADAQTQVTASLVCLSDSLAPESLLNLEKNINCEDIILATMMDAASQQEQLLMETRATLVQTEVACCDQAVQIGKLLKVAQSLEQERKELEVEIEGVKIAKICSSQQIRRNVNMVIKRCMQMRRKTQDSIAHELEAQQTLKSTQPVLFSLEKDINDVKVKLNSVKREEAPLVGQLEKLHARHQSEEDAEQHVIEQCHTECDYQGLARHDLERRLIDAQNQLQLELGTYELSLTERLLLEEKFQQRCAEARPALDRLNGQNGHALMELVAVVRERSAADAYIDENGMTLMTQLTATTFALQRQEVELFENERQLERLVASLGAARRTEAQLAAQLIKLRPQVVQLDEQIQCADSELRFLRDMCAEQERRLCRVCELISEWERLKFDYHNRHQLYLQQARRKTNILSGQYRSGVEINAQLLSQYVRCVQLWLAARMKTAGRLEPQLALHAGLADQLQVVRLVRTGLCGTDHSLALRHLYFSGEQRRGQARLAELSQRVRDLKGDAALACDHVLRMFMGLMKHEVPFVLRWERETDVSENATQTERQLAPQQSPGDTVSRHGDRNRHSRVAPRTADLDRPCSDRGHARTTLPAITRRSERPTVGVGNLHHKTLLPKL